MWTCAGCQEDLDDEFDTCWNCGTIREGESAEPNELPFGVTFDGQKYCYQQYRYDRLEDAVNYAQGVAARSEETCSAAALSHLLVTTTDSVEGRTITEYLGTVNGADLYNPAGLLGGGMAKQGHLHTAAVAAARRELIASAAAMGADAVVGLNAVTSIGASYAMVGLIGTAVKLSPAE